VTPDQSQLASWRSLRNLATADSSPSLAQVCDPNLGTFEDAVRRARLCRERSDQFDVKLSAYLQTQCLAEHLQIPAILRGLEVLDTITEPDHLLRVLRCFLRLGVPQVASKCVLMLGRRCPSPDWMKHVMAEGDDRVRANLIESLWGRAEVEDVQPILQDALRDGHHRVAANAAYGLFLCGHDDHRSGIELLISSRSPEYRRAGIWVIKTIGGGEAVIRVKPLIGDSDALVRRAAFAALVTLRQQTGRR
jgi:hypothetical protein